MVKVRGVDLALAVNFSVEVATALKDVLTILPAIERSSKPEVVVIFSYDTHGESLYVRPVDVSVVNARILRKLYEPLR